MTITVNNLGTSTSTANSASYDWGNFNAPADGLMVVCFTAGGSNSRDVSSISIGGTAGTLISQGTAGFKLAIAYREVSSGNNNVTCTLDGTNGTTSTAAVSVFLLENASTSSVTSDTDAGAGTSKTVSINMGNGGFAIFGVINTQSGDTISWTAATEDLDTNPGGNRHGFGHYTASGGAETPHDETASWAGSAAGARMIGAAFTAAVINSDELGPAGGAFDSTGMGMFLQPEHGPAAGEFAATGSFGYLFIEEFGTAAGVFKSWHGIEGYDTVTDRRVSRGKLRDKWWASLLYGRY